MVVVVGVVVVVVVGFWLLVWVVWRGIAKLRRRDYHPWKFYNPINVLIAILLVARKE